MSDPLDWRELHSTLIRLGHERAYALAESWGKRALKVFVSIRPHEWRPHWAFKSWRVWRLQPSDGTRADCLRVPPDWLVVEEDQDSTPHNEALTVAPARSIREGVRLLLFGTADPSLLWETLALIEFVKGMTSVLGPTVGQEFAREIEAELEQVPT